MTTNAIEAVVETSNVDMHHVDGQHKDAIDIEACKSVPTSSDGSASTHGTLQNVMPSYDDEDQGSAGKAAAEEHAPHDDEDDDILVKRSARSSSSSRILWVVGAVVVLAIIIGLSVGLTANNDDSDDGSDRSGSVANGEPTTPPNSGPNTPESDSTDSSPSLGDHDANFDEIVSLIMPALEDEPLLYTSQDGGSHEGIMALLNDPQTVQNKVLNWLATAEKDTNHQAHVTVDEQQDTVQSLVERYALGVVFSSLFEVGWQHEWFIRPDSHICNWNDGLQKGALCDSNKRISSLLLEACTLQGPIPAEIALLKELVVINLADNNITGPLPVTLRNMDKLQRLELQHNQIEGLTLESTVCEDPSPSPFAVLSADCGDAQSIVAAKHSAGVHDIEVTCSCCTSCCKGETCISNR